MKLNRTMLRAGMAILAASGVLQAQEMKRFEVGLNVFSGFTTVKDYVNSGKGFSPEFGYNGMLAKTDVPFRATLALNFFPGAENNGVKRSMTSQQLAGDLFINTGFKNLRLISGLSVNKYKVKTEAGGSSDSVSVKGLKIGARFGLDFVYNPNWSFTALVQLTELGTDSLNVSPKGKRPINPSWLQVGAKIHF